MEKNKINTIIKAVLLFVIVLLSLVFLINLLPVFIFVTIICIIIYTVKKMLVKEQPKSEVKKKKGKTKDMNDIDLAMHVAERTNKK